MEWRRRTMKGATGLAAGVVLLGFGLVGGTWYALEHPWILCRATERAIDWPEGSIEVADLEFDWQGHFTIRGLEVVPPMPTAPMVDLEVATGTLPDPRRIWARREIDLGDVTATGVVIEQRQRRLPSERPPPPPKALTLVASSVTLEDGWYIAHPDPPFKAVSVRGVEGALTGIRWTPARRSIAGFGRAFAGEMVLGNLEVTDLTVPYLLLVDGDLRLANSTFYYGRTQGLAEGSIRNLAQKPTVEIDVRLEGSRIETAVEDAMSRSSPVMGWLEAELTIHAGGELKRGDARFEGWVRLSDAYVFVGQELKLIPRLLLDVAPWFQREGGGWLAVGDLYGEASFGRGWVELDRMERMSNRHRILQAWGELKEGRVDLTVRAVPKRKVKGGVGVRVRGPLQEANIKLAKKGDLVDAPEVMVVD